MDDKMNKWLCGNFKKSDGNVTIGSILLVCSTVGFVWLVLHAFLIIILGITGFAAQGIYMDIINDDSFDVTRPFNLIDCIIGLVFWCFLAFVIYILNYILEYKVTSCERED